MLANPGKGKNLTKHSTQPDQTEGLQGSPVASGWLNQEKFLNISHMLVLSSKCSLKVQVQLPHVL